MNPQDRSAQLDYIRGRTSEAAICELLAEEASELSQAALKLARVLRGEVPTMKSEASAREHLNEEYADVQNVGDVLDIRASFPIMSYKLQRWVNRLGGMEEEKTE